VFGVARCQSGFEQVTILYFFFQLSLSLDQSRFVCFSSSRRVTILEDTFWSYSSRVPESPFLDSMACASCKSPVVHIVTSLGEIVSFLQMSSHRRLCTGTIIVVTGESRIGDSIHSDFLDVIQGPEPIMVHLPLHLEDPSFLSVWSKRSYCSAWSCSAY
jgi:hypothetical protein